MNIFSRIILAILFAVCLQSVGFAESPSDGSERLTEQSILSFLKAQDDALIRGDASAFISALSDNYTETTERPGKALTKRSRAEAEAGLVKLLPQLSNIHISHEDRKINISQDGRSATVTTKDLSTVTIGDKNLEMLYLSTSMLELQGGKIVYTSEAMSIIEEKLSMNVLDVAARPTDCTYFPEDTRVDQYDIGQAHFKKLAGLFGFSNPVPFCRMYKADAKTVSANVQSIMLSLGNPIKVADVANGFFSTDVVERHAVMSEWQDSYSITVQEAKAGQAVVRVLRPVHIQSGRGFQQKESDGYNEMWILSQITERLASRKNETPSPSTSTQPSASAASAVSVEEQLKKLQELHDKKVITDEEYKAMRTKALGL